MPGSTLPVFLALLALLLPAPAGLLVPLATLLLRPLRGAVGLHGLAGLTLLAACTPLALLARGPPPRPPACHAIRLSGTWRWPPTEPQHLETQLGPLAVQLAADVRAPPPGTPVEALLRLDAEGAATVVALHGTGPPRGAWLDRWARACAARLRQLVSRDDAALLAALVLGQRDDLGWPDRRAFTLTGTAHVLAISGQQVTLVAGALGAASAGGAWLRPALLLGAFVAVAGAGAPLVRSALGWLLLLGAARLARPADSLHRLAGIALLMLCWQPALRDSLSAQLSFLAVAGLIAGARLGPGALALATGPLGAWLATAPLCVEVFGITQPAGLLVTPLLTPPLAAVLILSLVAVLPGTLFCILDPLVAPLLQGSLQALRWVVTSCARIVPAPLRPPPPPLPGALLGLLVVAALVALGRRRTSLLERLA
jgi:predicted membrane metal-binding protein